MICGEALIRAGSPSVRGADFAYRKSASSLPKSPRLAPTSRQVRVEKDAHVGKAELGWVDAETTEAPRVPANVVSRFRRRAHLSNAPAFVGPSADGLAVVRQRRSGIAYCASARAASVLTRIGFSHHRADLSAGFQRVANRAGKPREPAWYEGGQNGSGNCCGDERFHDGIPVVCWRPTRCRPEMMLSETPLRAKLTASPPLVLV